MGAAHRCVIVHTNLKEKSWVRGLTRLGGYDLLSGHGVGQLVVALRTSQPGNQAPAAAPAAAPASYQCNSMAVFSATLITPCLFAI